MELGRVADIWLLLHNTSQLGSITQHGTQSLTRLHRQEFNNDFDERAKENIVDAPSASDDIDAIQVRSFDWKADGEHQKYEHDCTRAANCCTRGCVSPRRLRRDDGCGLLKTSPNV